LDFISENILIQALQQYKGAFVVVSHNRHFVSRIANKIWYIEDQQIKEYPGTYDEYEYWRKKTEAEQAAKADTGQKNKPKTEKPVEIKTKTPPQVNPNQLKALEKDLKKVEEEIEQLQNQRTTLEADMATPAVYSDFKKLNEKKAEFDKVVSSLDAANKKWEEIALAIDSLG
jgi:ATP-binding cassette subfamily F protein 3